MSRFGYLRSQRVLLASKGTQRRFILNPLRLLGVRVVGHHFLLDRTAFLYILVRCLTPNE
jgi:hypothetical protein